MARDCAQSGHVWLEADGKVFARHQERAPGKVAVHCQFCDATGAIEGSAKATAPPR